MNTLKTKMVICNVDNFINNGNDFLPSDFSAIKLFSKCGGIFIPATDKLPADIAPITQRMAYHGPILVWQGKWLYSTESESFDAQEILNSEESKATVSHIIDAYPSASVGILSANGNMYFTRVNTISHTVFKASDTPYYLCELNSIPKPWMAVNIYSDSLLAKQIQSRIIVNSETKFEFMKRDYGLSVLPYGEGIASNIQKLCKRYQIETEETEIIGFHLQDNSICNQLSSYIDFHPVDESNSRFRQLDKKHCCGFIGEELYRICTEKE